MRGGGARGGGGEGGAMFAFFLFVWRRLALRCLAWEGAKNTDFWYQREFGRRAGERRP